jgi:hypothetical protein
LYPAGISPLPLGETPLISTPFPKTHDSRTTKFSILISLSPKYLPHDLPNLAHSGKVKNDPSLKSRSEMQRKNPLLTGTISKSSTHLPERAPEVNHSG